MLEPRTISLDSMPVPCLSRNRICILLKALLSTWIANHAQITVTSQGTTVKDNEHQIGFRYPQVGPLAIVMQTGPANIAS